MPLQRRFPVVGGKPLVMPRRVPLSKTPKVVFKFSGIYAYQFPPIRRVKAVRAERPEAGSFNTYEIRKGRGSAILSRTLFDRKMRELEPEWRRVEGPAMEMLSQLTGLPWKVSRIKCYVTGQHSRTYGFSDPLTLPIIGVRKQWFTDSLIHELGHRMLWSSGNRKYAEQWAAYVDRKYRGESPNTRYHILEQALQAVVLENLFGKKRVHARMSWEARSPQYRRAWEIVKQMGGPRAVIDKFIDVRNRARFYGKNEEE